MNKYFSKTLFCGKQALYLPTCHSTNLVAAEQIRHKAVSEGFLVYTGFQSSGRGQMGNAWESAPDQNILMSLVLQPHFLRVQDQFFLSMACALALTDALNLYHKGPWLIKWPNDVLMEDQKIAGILIENFLSQDHLAHAILGVGININQAQFEHPHASSLSMLASQFFDTEEVLETVLLAMEKWYIRLKNHQLRQIEDSYYERLKGYGTWEKYRSGIETFDGKITGVKAGGKLEVELRDGSSKSFGIKEIQFAAG